MNKSRTSVCKAKKINRISIGLIFLGLTLMGSLSLIFYRNALSSDVKLIEAIDSGDIPKFKDALRSGANPDFVDEIHDTPLTLACNRDHYEMVQELIEAGADTNKPEDSGYTPLMYACQNMNIKMVKLLLAKGANSDVKNSKGWTARDIALQYKQTEILKILPIR